MDELSEICCRLKSKRLECKLSVRELAKRSGVSRSLISNYELGDVKNFAINRIEAIAKALGTTPAWIMGWDEPNCIEEYVIDNIVIIYNNQPITIKLSDTCEINIKGHKLSVISK